MQAGKAVNTLHRERMQALEDAIRDQLTPIDLQVNHHFAFGTYTREMLIPAGTVATGKIHRYDCTNILTKGKLLVVSDEGEREVSAGAIFKSGPNVKKAVYALEDSILVNVHPWHGEQDIAQIEAYLIIPPERRLEVSP